MNPGVLQTSQQKCLLILGDGMADEPIAELGGRTVLEAASTPNMDYIARHGRMGMLQTIPSGFEPGSDIANLSVLGYDPARYYTGRGPLEAASMGVVLAHDDIAYRCNLVTVQDGVMADFSAGHISSEEGRELFASLQPALAGTSLYSGISYRNLLLLHHARGAETTPPHDIVGKEIDSFLPEGEDKEILRHCMKVSAEVFADHPVNRARAREGKSEATMIWPWSGGKTPSLPSFQEQFSRSGGMISGVDLLFGIARIAKMEVIRVPGATGYLDTNYREKIRYAVDAAARLDFVYVHVEAPDEAGHLGSIEEKIRAIERLDEAIGIALEEFDGMIVLLPDHPTPIRLKTHTRDPVPFAVLGLGRDETTQYSEREGERGSYGILQGPELLPFLFSRTNE
ncbi:MAG: cofactor-independent phosphoglycerate mutase [Methanocalculus sp. MSAO_Arc1]|uniref:cofactor-independent phosphoglycerate mutase n=1 Tax=Methanocalculus TaxID=71151 RepID=UPI000FEECF3C|nr:MULTISPECIES: cofactor-independent phosphoglycerate mutase [unclassified Methanocalculus]RQD79733.1 MAG: cofactor-independent phosphoglycerate mutase [Methanocalculus sp. MSAO_Arc1]